MIRFLMYMVNCVFLAFFGFCQKPYAETFRPQFHFSPAENWINDPCGMFYYQGKYHLMYQYNPYGTDWGNMSWGHAVSTDMIHWEEQEVALVPDALGAIFSGGAVVDTANTTGFGSVDETPIVAIYTSAGAQQTQSIAYSLDAGKSWKKYAGNPVLPNQGTIDFRDPMVFWHEPTAKWIMALAASDRIEFYSSPNLKSWDFESEFGRTIGSHGGVWECPDMFVHEDQNGGQRWILLVSINPGGPQGGSATQYFIGDFDGSAFTLLPEYEAAFTAEAELPDGVLFDDFEGGAYTRWTATGEAFGSSPANGTLEGQMEVSGFLGGGLVNSYLSGDGTTGALTSEEFTIEHQYINFLIGGGNHPGAISFNLVINSKVVRTATGSNAEKLKWTTWEVSELIGQSAQLVIVDNHQGGWGHINVDHILFANEPVIDSRIEAFWLDYGTDNYAGRSFVNFSKQDPRRVYMGWMNNWSYAGDIPTSTWRGSMTIPRSLTLIEKDQLPRLYQQPVREIKALRKGEVVWSGLSIEELNDSLISNSIRGRAYEMMIELEVSEEDEFELNLRELQAIKTVMIYDVDKQELVIDRTSSGAVRFNGSFPGRYKMPLSPIDGRVKLHVFVDHSSLEVFANDGEKVFTTRIFPSPDAQGISVNNLSGSPRVAKFKFWPMESIWSANVLSGRPEQNIKGFFPNPVKTGSLLHIENLSSNTGIVKLYSLYGAQVMSQNVDYTQPEVRMKVSPGMYLIEVHDGERISRGKLLVK